MSTIDAFHFRSQESFPAKSLAEDIDKQILKEILNYSRALKVGRHVKAKASGKRKIVRCGKY